MAFVMLLTVCLCSCDDNSIPVNTPNDKIEGVSRDDIKVVYHLDNGEPDVTRTLADEILVPSRDGYSFLGWCLDENRETVINVSELYNENGENKCKEFNLYAKWQEYASIAGVELKAESFDYDGKPHTLTLVGVTEEMEVVYKGQYSYVDAGEYEIVCTIRMAEHKDLELKAAMTINPAKIDMSGVGFEDKTFTWSGEKYFLEIDGDLPAGVTVRYDNNGQSSVGVYKVTAHFDAGKNYQPIDDMTATLTINEKMLKVRFFNEDGSYVEKEIGYGKTLEDIPEPLGKLGYSAKWETEDGHEPNYENITSDIMLYARYEAEVYTINYIINGGTISGDAKQEYTVEDTVSLPLAEKKYYNFLGWFSNSDESSDGEPVSSIAKGSTGNRTFYARYEAIEFVVRYDVGEGTNDTTNINDLKEGTYVYTFASSPSDECPNLELADAVRAGYDFVAWKDENGAVVEIIDRSAPRNMVLTAEWKIRKYTITFDYQYEGIPNETIVCDINTDFYIEEPEREDALFNGWNTEPNGDGQVITSIADIISAKITETTITLYADWFIIYKKTNN